VKKSASVSSSLDIDRLIREEVTEWFTSNRKGLETTFRRVAEKVREDLEAYWTEENAALRERVRSAEEEVKRMRQLLAVVRSQVTGESAD
jgi:hypothetical protein